MDNFFIYSINIKNYIGIYNDNGYFVCEAKEMPNDIFESGNVILSFGKTLIEIFSFEHDQNNNNNNININNQNNNNNKFVKKYEIPLNNNNNPNNNNDNNNDNNEILCVYLYQNNIICGHRSGFISIWTPTAGVYLQKKGEFRPSESAVNKIIFTKFSDGNDYLLSCCADNTVKILSLEGKVLKNSQNYGYEVMDIKMVNDIDGNNLFIISLKNGELKVLDMQLNLIMDIPSRFSTNKIRYVIGMKKPNTIQDDTIGDILIITEGKNLDVFTWIKPESINIKIPHNNMPHALHQPHFHHNQGVPYFGYGKYH